MILKVKEKDRSYYITLKDTIYATLTVSKGRVLLETDTGCKWNFKEAFILTNR